MKAIILAAGIGSRLRPMTNYKPKTLVEVNGKPMLKYIVDSLVNNDVEEIIVCTGFESRKIVNFCKTEYPYVDFTFVDNKDFETTNNLYSLYLAREHLTGDFILMNADLVFDSDIIAKLISTPTGSICVDKDRYLEESMKVTVTESGLINRISKQVPAEDSYGCSIDIYKLLNDQAELLRERLIEVIEVKNHRNEWTETLLDTLMSSGALDLYPMDIGTCKWFEIDNYDDLLEAEILFNSFIPDFPSKLVYVLDMDGTLYLGNELIQGTREFIETLTSRSKKIFVMTNNSSRPPFYYKDKLEKLGLTADIEIISSLDLALNYFSKKNLRKLYWVANPQVDQYIRDMGFVFDDQNPQGLLVTYDTDISYIKLLNLTKFISKGIPYYATHTDMVCPTEWGYDIPDIGTYIELIRMTTQVSPQMTFGKPSLIGIQNILKKEKVALSDVVIVGDRLYTDIKLAEGTDITSVLVLSGETSRDMVEESSIKPDIIVRKIDDLIQYI